MLILAYLFVRLDLCVCSGIVFVFIGSLNIYKDVNLSQVDVLIW